ncbi:MAG: hypothetical protein KatS3mg129_1775 [Leptospiraceae bacterium]|nr:MAG: hypothetical protein KatS3mg129_1775 [Leptospiraceae bacterium]
MKEYLKKNPGLSLFVLNIFLFVLFIIINDPFHLISKTYESAPKILNLELNEIQDIIIQFPDKKREYHLKLTEMYKNKNHTIEDFIKNTNWKLIIKENQKSEEYEIDKENLKEFLETLKELKRYYALPDTAENRTIAGINNNSSKIIIKYKNDKKDILKIGFVSIRNNSSYIQLNNEDKIYQVENNLKLKSGFEDIYYFRNHQITNFDKDKLQKIIVYYNNKRIIYAKTGKEWQLLEPKPANLQNSSMEGILDEINHLKATQFYNDENPLNKDWEILNLKIELEISREMESPSKEILNFIAKKDYVKYLLQYKNQYYEISVYRIEDLLEPEKLIEKQ